VVLRGEEFGDLRVVHPRADLGADELGGRLIGRRVGQEVVEGESDAEAALRPRRFVDALPFLRRH
jgi:hypothetical protein